MGKLWRGYLAQEVFGPLARIGVAKLFLRGIEPVKGTSRTIVGGVVVGLDVPMNEDQLMEGEVIFLPAFRGKGTQFSGMSLDQALLNGYSEPEYWEAIPLS